MSAGEIITIIASTAAALVAVINAVAGGWGRRAAEAGRDEARTSAADTAGKLEMTATKLDEIHAMTNGNLADVQAKLTAALDRIARLELLIAAMHTDPPPPPKGSL